MKQKTEFTLILQPSPLGGVGVFAAEDIPNGMNVGAQKFVIRKIKIEDIPQIFRKYCIYLNDEECVCPEQFDRMEIGWYHNHSNDPNIAKTADGCLVAIRDIKAGEEVLLDYNQLNEPEHLKESYYKIKD